MFVGRPQGGGLGGQASLGQRHRELLGGHVEGLADDVVGRHQPVASSLEPFDLLAEGLAPPGQVAQHPLAHPLRLGHHLAAVLAPPLDLRRRLRLGLGGQLGAPCPDGRHLGLRLGPALLEQLGGLGPDPRRLGLGLGP